MLETADNPNHSHCVINFPVRKQLNIYSSLHWLHITTLPQEASRTQKSHTLPVSPAPFIILEQLIKSSRRKHPHQYLFLLDVIDIWYLLDKSEHYATSQCHPFIVEPVLLLSFYAIINDMHYYVTRQDRIDLHIS